MPISSCWPSVDNAHHCPNAQHANTDQHFLNDMPVPTPQLPGRPCLQHAPCAPPPPTCEHDIFSLPPWPALTQFTPHAGTDTPTPQKCVLPTTLQHLNVNTRGPQLAKLPTSCYYSTPWLYASGVWHARIAFNSQLRTAVCGTTGRLSTPHPSHHQPLLVLPIHSGQHRCPKPHTAHTVV
jgi:hypothetical protein